MKQEDLWKQSNFLSRLKFKKKKLHCNNSISGCQITQNVSTSHSRISVVLCGKFLSNYFIRILDKTENEFQSNLIVMEKSLVKLVPGVKIILQLYIIFSFRVYMELDLLGSITKDNII